jgi:hypothetical protein
MTQTVAEAPAGREIHGLLILKRRRLLTLRGSWSTAPSSRFRLSAFRILPEVLPRDRTRQRGAIHFGLFVSSRLDDAMTWQLIAKPGVRESCMGACYGILLVERRSPSAYLHGPREAGSPRPPARADRSLWQPRIDASFWSSGQLPRRFASELDDLSAFPVV